MANDNLSTLVEDEHQIANLLIRWGHARDSDDWETLAGCFHDDGTICISWISGPAKDFIARSRAMAAARKPGEHSKHFDFRAVDPRQPRPRIQPLPREPLYPHHHKTATSLIAVVVSFFRSAGKKGQCLAHCQAHRRL